MNIYEKLNKARLTLQDMKLKKSGENKFAKYEYFELQDFLPHINRIFSELGLFSMVTFENDIASLFIFDIEKPEDNLTFTSPMREASLKGCHPIQNLGAVETYQRRYLYQTALEIVEHDILDRTHDPDDKDKTKQNHPPKKESKISDKVKLERALELACKEQGLSLDAVKQYLHDTKKTVKQAWNIVQEINEQNLSDDLSDYLIVKEQWEE